MYSSETMISELYLSELFILKSKLKQNEIL